MDALMRNCFFALIHFVFPIQSNSYHFFFPFSYSYSLFSFLPRFHECSPILVSAENVNAIGIYRICYIHTHVTDDAHQSLYAYMVWHFKSFWCRWNFFSLYVCFALHYVLPFFAIDRSIEWGTLTSVRNKYEIIFQLHPLTHTDIHTLLLT